MSGSAYQPEPAYVSLHGATAGVNNDVCECVCVCLRGNMATVVGYCLASGMTDQIRPSEGVQQQRNLWSELHLGRSRRLSSERSGFPSGNCLAEAVSALKTLYLPDTVMLLQQSKHMM